MDCVKNNNEITVSEKPNNIIGRKIMGTTECGKCNVFFITEILVKTLIYLAAPIISINIITKTKSI